MENIHSQDTTLQILQQIQKLMRELNCEQERFPGRIIFMSMYNDITWGNEENERSCLANSIIVGCYAKKFALGH